MKKLFNKIFGRNRGYASDIDRFIFEFDRANNFKKSDSQQREINKHNRVFYLRDNVVKEQESAKVWRNF